MSITIALAGNPNSGKTTLFNALTGSAQYVGNWPGVTVEKKEGKLKGNKEVVIQDLPGIYSLSPYTLEEVVTRNYLVNERPDAIINIVDATNIERNLYLTTQLLELEIPVVIALNMMDIIEKNGDTIDTARLSSAFACPVVEISALKGDGTVNVVEQAMQAAQNRSVPRGLHFSKDVEDALDKIYKAAGSVLSGSSVRWLTIKLFERDEKVKEGLELSQLATDEIEKIIIACEQAQDDSSDSIITTQRYMAIGDIVSETVVKKNLSGLSTSDRIDRVLTNRILALPIFAGIMFLVYYLSIGSIGGFLTDWINEELFGDELLPAMVAGWLEAIGTAEWLTSLVVEGIVAGVGAVLGFLPQMLVLFICLAILEDCGYMARIAFIMDRVFRKFGLSGKSFIPILIGTGCGVPGIMASRTIENEKDRRMTVITTTFIPCGAKLPIIALIAGAFFGGSALIAASSYFLGIGAIIITGIILKKTRLFAGEPAPFVMELPAYHVPGVKSVFKSMLDRGFAFVKKAGSIVLLSTVLIWFLGSFSWSLEMVETDESILASIGNLLAPLFTPLGWPDWRAAVATISGLIAKENLVSTFGVLFGFVEEIAEDGEEIWPTLAAAFTPLAAYSLLVFNLLCAPCFAAIGAVRREMMSPRWTWFAIGFQTVFAYLTALVIFQIGSFITEGIFGIGTIVALLVIAGTIYLLVRKPYDQRQSRKAIDLQEVGA